ncbi:hypothetical protein K438DRAFT_2014382 [Mycena galopus ATCC 62051]|nr:hypothetical protein K438DRAFT_2014382 [Mycena galopus ATCC 62051]
MASSPSFSSLTKSTTFSSVSQGSSLNIPDAVTANLSSSSAESLYQVKLLSALWNGDPALIHPFFAEIGKEKWRITAPAVPAGAVDSETSSGDLDTGAVALHLAIWCASRQS